MSYFRDVVVLARYFPKDGGYNPYTSRRYGIAEKSYRGLYLSVDPTLEYIRCGKPADNHFKSYEVHRGMLEVLK